jgi:serine protease Do
MRKYISAIFLTNLFLGTLWAQSDSDQAQTQSRFQALQNQLQMPAQLRSGGSYLGVRLLDVDAGKANALKLGEERGVLITSVEDGSPAENAGIKANDVILSYNGEKILGAQQFVRLVAETPAGRKVAVQLWRDGKTLTLNLVIGALRERAAPSNFITFPPVSAPAWFYIPDMPKPLMLSENSVLGIECEPLNAQLAAYFGVKGGLLVRSVQKSSAAEKVGLKAGDVITEIGSQSLTNNHDLSSYFRSYHQRGASTSLTLTRNHKQLRLDVPNSDIEESLR